MGQYSSYYLYQKYEKRGDQPFVPVYPAVYSVDGDGTREPVVKNENDYQCGWTGETGTLYRWVDLPIDTDYVCDECPDPIYRWVETSGYMCNGVTKFNREIKQVSYDEGISWHDTADYRAGSTIIEQKSADCGYAERWVETGEYRCEYSADTPDAQYRWVNIPINEDYMCSGTSKYYKEVYQVSTDGGSTWSDVVPAQYRMGDLYEASSSDCESEPYSGQYFTIESLVDNNGVWFESHNSRTISASTDGGNTWTEYTASSGNNRPTIATLNTGQKVLIKGLNSTYYDLNGTGYVSNFDTSGNYIVYGNIMSLVYGDSFATATTLTGDHNFVSFFSGKKLISAANLVLPATTLTDYCYAAMFSGCGYLTAAPELPATTLANACYNGMFRGTSLTTAPELPATTLANACYGGMFYNCTNLTTAPELPATTLANACYHSMFQACRSLTAAELPATTLVSNCYRFMFQSCTSLVNAPELPATTLADNCYGGMFLNCTSLTTVPELPATTLVDGCYANMFDGCKRLNYIKAMFTTTPGAPYTDSWVDGVASSGTFVKNSAATWYLRGVDGIPTGWTVQNA